MRRRVAAVTGASRGIGAAVATRLAQDGYDLILTCRIREEELNARAQKLRSLYHISCTTFCGDLSDPALCRKVFEEADELDVLVNNAGVAGYGLLTDLTEEAWQDMVGTNLTAPLFLAKHAIPLLMKKQGCIINISSVWGGAGASMEVAYSATKGGLNAMTKALAKELAPSGVRVNAIACGWIDTDMNARFSEEERQDAIDRIPAGRTGQPEDVAEAVLMLVNGNSYLTGQVIGLDGGWV
ncbi:MAG: SDR family oxidoreductase [Lachnospiraceae bacterium]|nr:SDR family oxidoreductase [Lachnospiraceae bacterium]